MTTSTQRKAGHRAAAWVFVVLAGLLLVLAGTAAGAQAARVGPLASATLLGQSTGYGAITSSFGNPSGTSLVSTTTACSAPWTVTGGTMQISSGMVASMTNALVTASVPLCFSSGPNAEAAGELRTSGNSGTFGVLVHAASGGRPSTAAIYDSGAGSLVLRRISATGTLTTLATRTGAGAGNGVRHLRLLYLDGVYTVAINDTVLITHTVPDATTRTAYETNRAVGIVAVNDTKTAFDNFQGYPR